LLDVFFKSNGIPKPIIVFSHGFKGFKDWGHFNLLAQIVAEQNFVFVKFNFSYNGTTKENPLDFADLDAFGNNNYTTELNDLGKVIDWVLSTEILANEIDAQQLNLLGHSRGGGITILKAREDKRVKKIVTWASVADFINPMKKYDVKEWKKKGVLYSINTRTNQQMPLYYQLYKNTIANTERLDIIKAAKELTVPFLIIHGTNDEAVSVEDANSLHYSCKHSELLLIDGAGHTFGAKHPFEANELPFHAEIAVNKTIEFFRK
jgi:dipeptidyl aminopeptidase/acylaminoacyl peptidase